ncbi:MAG: hypothetical protein HYV26_17525 [Candidatus Hydrogenedentes bacterium]|nr:hypothetical protein [Candidatus Hydrogenedentota bacterium]
MTGKTFFNALANGEKDVLALLLELLEEEKAAYCLIGGLAVNAYAEPVVSLDLDLVVVADALGSLCRAAAGKGFTVHHFPHSVNLSLKGSDLRVQLQTDERYQEFIARASTREVLGYSLRVAALEDVLQGKSWAYADTQRRASKRQKDLADIMRLVEAHSQLKQSVSPEIQRLLT